MDEIASVGRAVVTRLTWTHAADTSVGRVRHQNEDSFYADGDAGAFVVADGMGGHAAGEVASEMAVRFTFAPLVVLSTPCTVAEIRHLLDQAVRTANLAIFENSRENPQRAGMGTTVTVLVILPDGSYVIGHVGDSRAYLYREGELLRLTEDHTYVQQLVNRGKLTDEQARTHPRASLLTRALGTDSQVGIDLYDGEARAGDRFLLASDGLTSMLSDTHIAEEMARDEPPDRVVGRLVEAANEAGGTDNITVVVVDVSEGEEAAP